VAIDKFFLYCTPLLTFPDDDLVASVPPFHIHIHLGLFNGVEGGIDVLCEPDVLEHAAEGLAHHEGVGVEVQEAGRLVADQPELGQLDGSGGEGDVDGGGHLGLGSSPVQVPVHQLTSAAQLSGNSQKDWSSSYVLDNTCNRYEMVVLYTGAGRH
jgi:hypothetical protein